MIRDIHFSGTAASEQLCAKKQKPDDHLFNSAIRFTAAVLPGRMRQLFPQYIDCITCNPKGILYISVEYNTRGEANGINGSTVRGD